MYILYEYMDPWGLAIETLSNSRLVLHCTMPDLDLRRSTFRVLGLGFRSFCQAFLKTLQPRWALVVVTSVKTQLLLCAGFVTLNLEDIRIRRFFTLCSRSIEAPEPTAQKQPLHVTNKRSTKTPKIQYLLRAVLNMSKGFLS